MVKKSGPQLWVRTSSFSHPHNSASQLIRKHLFNCKVQLLLPVQSEEASSSLNVPDISAFHYSVRARTSLFADQAFISRNIADAGFQCLSYGHTYGLAVTPDSHLHLALPKDLYQTAGLQASQIADTEEYHADIKLTGQSFCQGSLYHDRVVKGLQRCPGPIQLLCARAVDSAVTEVVHLTDNDNIISHECLANDYKQTKLQAAAPSTECWQQMIADIATANTAGQAEDCDASNDSMNRLHDLYEWVGAMNCGIQDFDLQTNEEQSHQMLLSCHTWHNFILPCQVEQALQSAQEQVAKQLCPWAILSVWGYTDQPMPWLGSPPSAELFTEKANDYSIVILPDRQYILFVASGSGDTFQTV